MWDLEAAIPEGTFSSKPTHADAKLQQMLQTMLAERFKVVMRRGSREVPVYLLKVGKEGPKFNGKRPVNPSGPVFMTIDPSDGKVKPSSELPPPPDGAFGVLGPMRDGVIQFDAANVSIANWTQRLFGIENRPVLDRTGLPGRFDFHFDYQTGQSRTGAQRGGPLPCGDCANREIVKAMGFELEESRAPFDVWVIVSAEKPSEN
jgi:uncharacterized protein (TIGR03435 family)